MFEEWERSSIKAPISNENKGPLIDGGILRLNEKSRWTPCSDLSFGNEIAKRTETAFEVKTGFLHDLRIKTNASTLNKILSICTRTIDRPRVFIQINIETKL